MHNTIEVSVKQHEATVLQWVKEVYFNTTAPGALKAEAPEEEKKVHTMRRVQRFNGYDYQAWADGPVALDVSSGAEALVYPPTGKKVRRSSWVVETWIPASSRNAWQWRQCYKGLLRTIEVNELRKMREWSPSRVRCKC
ncbi:hypothetical protein, unlikely [Trypanosoma congolense IL3000]|uniref:Uncharacterized protein n=1 Tax=Trypanosoma congolense (strain IL3000) TaxID=1068625 RepID=F9W4S8_TRYCI|nr:hypothetical protein, unlikely [Trypanosoma congolense IL3000]